MAVCVVIISLFLSLIAPVQLSAQDTSGGQVVAEVNGEKITVKDFEDAIAMTEKRLRRILNKEGKMEVLRSMINKVLLDQEAHSRNLDKLPEVVKEIERAKRNILIQTLLKTEVSDKIAYTEEELKDYYEKNIEKYEPVAVTANVISISKVGRDEKPVGDKARTVAGEIKTRMENGEVLHDIISHYTEAKDLIIFDRSFENKATVQFGEEVKDVARQITDMEPGTTSIFEAEGFIVVVTVIDKKKYTSFEFEKNKAASDLQYEIRNTLYNDFISSLREDATITINDDTVQ